MSKITAIIVTKNEEEMIADCLDSVSFCDEIFVVDSHSTDRTAEIAKQMGAKIVSGEWNGFAEQRNAGLQKAKTPWIVYLDADERVDETLRKNIQKIISGNNHEDAYRLQRKNFYFGVNEWPAIEKLERLFQKKSLQEWYGELHESAKVDGTVGDVDGYILHYTHRSLASMLEKTIRWSEVEAKLRYDAHHPPVVWWRFPRVMITEFYKYYISQKGYTIGIAGLIESMYQSFSIFITYARLWEMQQKGTIVK